MKKRDSLLKAARKLKKRGASKKERRQKLFKRWMGEFLRDLGPRALKPEKHAQVEKALLKLASPEMDERLEAIAELDYLIQHVDTIHALKEPLIRTGLKDRSPAVRRAAVSLMARFNKRYFKEALEKALRDKAGPSVALEAAQAFFHVGNYFDLTAEDRRRKLLFENEFLPDRWARKGESMAKEGLLYYVIVTDPELKRRLPSRESASREQKTYLRNFARDAKTRSFAEIWQALIKKKR